MEDIKPNTAHMALQIPQYFFITAGEVMFSVTGLEFSYSQVRLFKHTLLHGFTIREEVVGHSIYEKFCIVLFAFGFIPLLSFFCVF